ncbi:hypothetical protein AHIS2_p100 [Acaryochloris phage A-HIS2]|nr:hypothetical protein AHIS2_p100 [Acaryochloris phage A-HIS2]
MTKYIIKYSTTTDYEIPVEAEEMPDDDASYEIISQLSSEDEELHCTGADTVLVGVFE